MKILVVVDMQNDFITGSLGTKEAQAIVPKVKNKIQEAVKNGDLIIYTRDTHFCEEYLQSREGMKLPVEHCISGTPGWRIPDELLPPGDYETYGFVDKFTFGEMELPHRIWTLANSYYDDGMLTFDEIELVGLCTSICVVSNALILKAFFYNTHEISVDATCCACVTPASHEAALTTMQMCQINIKRG